MVNLDKELEKLRDLREKLATAQFKCQIAANLGWGINVSFWCEEEFRLEKEIARLEKGAKA